jgi:hypothetical protein
MSEKEKSYHIPIPRSKPPSDGIHPYPGESEERAIVRTFMDILRTKAQWMTSDSTIMEALDQTIRSPPYTAERGRITEMNNDMGLWKGVALGMGTFVFLRSGPRMLRWWLSPRSNSTWAYTLDRNPYSSNVPSPSVDVSPKIGLDPTTAGPSFFWKMVKLGMDTFVSLSMAAWGSFYFMDTQEMTRSISRMPLIEGKSLVSQLLCDDFIDLYQSIPRRKWDNYTNLHQQLEAVTGKKTNLMMIQDFVWNCIKRKTYEKQMSLESLSTSSTVSSESTEQESGDSWLGEGVVEIPYPGVPEDIEIVLEWKDKQDSDPSSTEDEDFFTEDSSF